MSKSYITFDNQPPKIALLSKKMIFYKNARYKNNLL